uniref:NET domain-containing protein n=1 Tax=Leersia perrieri TaxID=77586 RepID=A0A0D9WF22_9ORYZ
MAVGTAATAAAELPCDRRLMERIESERLAVRDLLKKAEALVARRKNRNGAAAKKPVSAPHSEARALPRRGKKIRPVVIPTTDGDASPKKRMKTGPMVEVEVIEPTTPMAQRDRLYGLLSSLSAEMPLPPHILGFIRSQCCCFACPDSDEMDVDLRSTKDAVLFKLLNLLDEFAQQETKIQMLQVQEPPKIEAVDSSDAVSRSSVCQLEEGEIVDEDMDICGGVSPLVVLDNVQFSPLTKPQGEEDELIDISEEKPLLEEQQQVTEQDKKVITERAASPDTEMQELIARSQQKQRLQHRKRAREQLEEMKSTAQPVFESIDPRLMKQLGITKEVEYMEGEIVDEDLDICGGVSPLVGVDNVQFTLLPKQQEEDDELIDICGGVSPSATSLKLLLVLARAAAAALLDHHPAAKIPHLQAVPPLLDHPRRAAVLLVLDHPAAVHPLQTATLQSDDDEDSASSSPKDSSKLPTEAEAKPLLEEHDKKLITEETAASQMKMARELQRKKSREQLEEMKRTAQPIYESIDPRLMKQPGITKEVEYMVSPLFSRDNVRRHRGGLLQQKLGFFLKE